MSRSSSKFGIRIIRLITRRWPCAAVACGKLPTHLCYHTEAFPGRSFMNRRSRYRGALLGLAAGDALGTTLEFRPPGSFEPITDIVGGGPFDLKPGEWTDDTTMTLC